MLRRTKAKLRSLLTPEGQPGAAPDSRIQQVVEEQISSLPVSRIKIEKTREELVQNGLNPEAPFADFLGAYARLQDGGEPNKALVERQKTDHQFMSDFAALAISFLRQVEKLPPTLAPLLRRHFYRFISILNSKDSTNIFEYKKDLPRVGLLYFPNPGPRQFVVDALSGMADIVDMEPGKMVETVWSLKGYNFDYGQYQQTLKERVEDEVGRLDPDFVRRFPSQEWLVKELSASLVYQWALVELLKLKYFDIIFFGAGEIPLSMALYDVPEDLLPPLVALCHGIPSGDPIMGFFTRVDRVLIRCEPEREFYQDLGVPAERMLEVGSASSEDFPSHNALQHARLNARYALGLDDDDTVIVYATTYDISIYNTKTCEEILDLMIDSFARAMAKGDFKNPVLYVKYHPSPASDPTFSYSRAQYPLSAFAKLSELGYRVRLADSIESVLPACDCFVAHESSTLTEALDWGIPTISIKMHKGLSKPLLGSRAYSQTNCHKHFSVYDSGEEIGGHIHALSTIDRQSVYKQSKQLWQDIFGSGRTAGLMKVADLVSTLLAK
jgi:hypothetical protein